MVFIFIFLGKRGPCRYKGPRSHAASFKGEPAADLTGGGSSPGQRWRRAVLLPVAQPGSQALSVLFLSVESVTADRRDGLVQPSTRPSTLPGLRPQGARLPAPLLPVLGPGLRVLRPPGSCPCGHALPWACLSGELLGLKAFHKYSTCDTGDHNSCHQGGELAGFCLPKNKLALGPSPEDPSPSQWAAW